jgi:hypothetical protein
LFNYWNDVGTLQAILNRLRGRVKIDKEVSCIDGAIIRAAKCAAGGGKKPIRKNPRTTRWAAVGAA